MVNNVDEIPKEVPAEQPPKAKTKREMLVDRLAEKYPDKKFEDDEELYGQVSDDYDGLNKELGEYKDREKQFADMFASNPRTASILMAFKKDSKTNPLIEIIRQFGPEWKDALDDPEKMEGLAEAQQDWMERQTKSEALGKEYDENMKKSVDYLNGLEESGTDPKVIDDATALITKIANEVIMGTYSPEAMDMAMKALSHDADVADAAHVGEVKGRNTKIKEEMRKSKAGDGTVHLGGANNVVNQHPRKSLGALDKASSRKSIWD